MTTLIRVLFNVFRMSPSELLTRVTGIYLGMNGNPAFPSPPVAMPDFKAVIDKYAAALTAALDRGKLAVTHRNSVARELWRIIRQLSRYVESCCGDSMEVFLSSGFQPVVNSRAQLVPLSESIRSIVPGRVSGQILVTAIRDPQCYSYELRWAPIASSGAAETWTVQAFAQVRPPAVVILTPGTTYAIQVHSLRASGFTDWSDSVTYICT